jgi:hypothetical protein
VTLFQRPTINSALLTVPDARASNGIVHIISEVLYQMPESPIVATLRTCPTVRTFVELLDLSELSKQLDRMREHQLIYTLLYSSI